VDGLCGCQFTLSRSRSAQSLGRLRRQQQTPRTIACAVATSVGLTSTCQTTSQNAVLDGAAFLEDADSVMGWVGPAAARSIRYEKLTALIAEHSLACADGSVMIATVVRCGISDGHGVFF
jgi:hypothetical protein